MAQKKTTKPTSVCAYCAKPFPKTEIEHVFPESWYPDGHPQAEMLTVPACSKCNRSYGRLEERLFFPFAATLDGDPLYKSVVERALRSVDPTAYDTVKSVSYRAKARRRAINQMKVLTVADSDTTLWSPNKSRQVLSPAPITTPAGILTNGVPGIRFNPDDLSALGVKLLRGAYFKAKGAPLPADVPCDSRAFSNDPSTVMDLDGWHQMSPPPFEAWFRRATEDDTVTIWWFRLWGRYVMSASSGFEDGPDGAPVLQSR